MARIFIVDDDPAMAEWVSNLCRDRGHQPFPFDSPQAAIDALPSIAPQLVIADLKPEKTDGFDILVACKESQINAVVVIIVGFESVELALKAMQSGAFDYVTKPFKGDELQFCIQRALEHQTALRRSDAFRRGVNQHKFENLIGTSAKMQSIYRLIGKVAETESTILIQGESGTGKELVARALHSNSSRQHHPFVAINCSARSWRTRSSLVCSCWDMELISSRKSVPLLPSSYRPILSMTAPEKEPFL
jgi:two-component system response regulator AtoC